jgi:predicted nucleic acid-binding protein
MTWTMNLPVAEKAIINASPLIFLSRSHHLDLLKAFASVVWVPESVAAEILHRGQQDITARAIKETEWLVTKSVPDIPITIAEWRLGAGESSVLALASEHSGTEVVIDDLAGRKCAASLNVPVRGTLGIVLIAKKRGLIPKARPVIEDMMIAGLYLSRKVTNQALRRVGE